MTPMKLTSTRPFNRLSVKWKILAPFCGLSGFVGVLLITMFMISFTRHDSAMVSERADYLSHSVAYAVETMADAAAVERYVSIVGGDKDVDLLLIVSTDDQRVVFSNRARYRNVAIEAVSDPQLQSELTQALSKQSPLEQPVRGGRYLSIAMRTPALIDSSDQASEMLVYLRMRPDMITGHYGHMGPTLMIALVTALVLAMVVASKLVYDLVVVPLNDLKNVAHTRGLNNRSMVPLTNREDEFGDVARGMQYSFAEARENADRLAQLAQSDGLTGLGNRVLFKDRLHTALMEADQSGQAVALMVLDLDNFKDVNDTLGHDVGDQLLVRIAEILRENTREDDTIVRLGGDEFAIIVAGVDRLHAISEQAHRILSALSAPQVLGSQDVHPGVSIGVTTFPQDGRDPDVLLKNADLALYRAKEEGRGNVQLYRHELHLRAMERNAIERDLRHAIGASELLLYYQPKVDLESGEIVGAEALIRWQHPERGMVPPDAFISIAEANGLICDLTDWVLEEACCQIRRWQDEGLPVVSVAINVSAHDLRRPDFTDRVANTLVRNGVSPRFLEIEVTESTMMEDVDHVIGTLRRLRALGVSISIDDFGTGYSSLAYLKRFPVKRLKIDRSFILDMSDDANSQAIPRLIVDLSRSLGVAVLAEGIETQAQRDILAGMGCEEGQGYLFGAPVPADSFSNMIRTARTFPSPRHIEDDIEDAEFSVA